MNEKLPQPDLDKKESQGIENLDLNKLSFEELRKLYEKTKELAKTSFKFVEAGDIKDENNGDKYYTDGFVNADGKGLFIGKSKYSNVNDATEEMNSEYYLTKDSYFKEFFEFLMITHNPNYEILKKGSTNKEELIKATKEIMTEFGYRIIN